MFSAASAAAILSRVSTEALPMWRGEDDVFELQELRGLGLLLVHVEACGEDTALGQRRPAPLRPPRGHARC